MSFTHTSRKVAATLVTSDDLEIDDGTLSINADLNRVGVGTTSPGVQLEVQDTTTSSANTGGQVRLSANDGAPMGDSHRLGVVEFSGAEDSSGTQVVGGRIEVLTDAAWTNVENGAAMYFYTTDADASQSLVLKMDSSKRSSFSGTLGIGTTVPGAQLDVHDTTTSSANTGGHIRLSSNDGAAMGDSHRLGVIEFTGAEDTSGTQTGGARIEALTDAAWTNAENGGALYFYTTDGNASQSLAFKLDSNKKATLGGDVQVAGDIILDDGGSLKEAGGTAAITFDGSGHVTKIGQDSPSSADVLTYDGSKWVAEAPTTGDITAVVAGTLLDGGATSGSATLNVDLTAATAATIAAGDYVVFLDGGTTGTQSKGSINDVATLFAGTSASSGLSASSGVLGVTGFYCTANNTANETVYPVFVDGATGMQGGETDTGLSYNPSTGSLTTAKVVLADDGTIGSASDTDAVKITAVGNLAHRGAVTLSTSTSDIDLTSTTHSTQFILDAVMADGQAITLPQPTAALAGMVIDIHLMQDSATSISSGVAIGLANGGSGVLKGSITLLSTSGAVDIAAVPSSQKAFWLDSDNNTMAGGAAGSHYQFIYAGGTSTVYVKAQAVTTNSGAAINTTYAFGSGNGTS